MENQTKKKSWVITFVAAGVTAILAGISYTTNLLGISITGNSTGILVSGGHSPEYTSTIFYPHFLGPFFVVAAVTLLGVGLVIIFRSRSNNTTLIDCIFWKP